jgi:hypothetical protein
MKLPLMHFYAIGNKTLYQKNWKVGDTMSKESKFLGNASLGKIFAEQFWNAFPAAFFRYMLIYFWSAKYAINPIYILGTGHKVTARVGRSDLGWVMENLWPVSMGCQVFCMCTVGPPNKNPYLLSSLIMINIIANKILKSNIIQI